MLHLIMNFWINRPTELAKVDILVAGEKVDALSMLVHKDRVSRGRGDPANG